MKEIEELFRKLRHHYRLFLKGSNDSFIKMNETETALLSKFREIQEQVERLKCCGNCYNFYQGTKCPHNYQAVNNICNNYDCDNLTRKERET